MPLYLLKIGEVGRIKKILGNDEVKKHILSLGFVIGEDVKVIATLNGDLIVDVKGTRIAIGKQMAQRIIV